MKEKELREIVRQQIVKKMNENPSRFSKQATGVRGLGAAKAGLDRSLGKIDTGAIAKLGRTQKIKLLTALLSNVGITAQDFASIKNLVGRNLADTIAPADESVEEVTTPGRVDMRMGQFKDEFAKKMKGKSAQAQMDLVIGLVKDLNIKGNESVFIQKLRKALKS